MRRLSQAAAHTPFDLARGPLLRTWLLRLAPAEAVVLVAMHHIISDGWSLGVLVKELGALYESFAAGRPSPLPALPLQYVDFAAWQRRWLSGETLEALTGWWKESLAGAPAAGWLGPACGVRASCCPPTCCPCWAHAELPRAAATGTAPSTLSACRRLTGEGVGAASAVVVSSSPGARRSSLTGPPASAAG